MAGKGSKPRPFSVEKDKFDDNWDRIFSQTTAAVHQNGLKDDSNISQRESERAEPETREQT